MKVKGKPHIMRWGDGWIVWRNTEFDNWWTWTNGFCKTFAEAVNMARGIWLAQYRRPIE